MLDETFWDQGGMRLGIIILPEENLEKACRFNIEGGSSSEASSTCNYSSGKSFHNAQISPLWHAEFMGSETEVCGKLLNSESG